MTISPRDSRRSTGAGNGMLISGGLFVALMGIVSVSALAGDLLRGGYTGNPSRSANPASLTPPSESVVRADLNDQLARTTQAIQAVTAMESKARGIALAASQTNLGINPNNPSRQLPNVPNGLGTGGLQPAAGAAANSSLWSGALLPTETTAQGETTVTVVQDKQDAVLTWTTFNVGSATTLDFNQGNTGASARSRSCSMLSRTRARRRRKSWARSGRLGRFT